MIGVTVTSSSDDYADVDVNAFLCANDGSRTQYSADVAVEEVSPGSSSIGDAVVYEQAGRCAHGVFEEMEARGETAVPEAVEDVKGE